MEKECQNCRYIESSYPLDPPTSLYCDKVEDYKSPNDSCNKFEEQTGNKNDTK